MMLSCWVLLAALLAHAEAKGSGGGGGRAGGRASYGGGGTISRGYTRTYFFVYAGTRHRCSSCSRTTEKDSMSREMQSVVVLAEFDVTFEPTTDLGTDDEPSAAWVAAEQYVEARVAGMVARKVPTVTLDDVAVRDSWRAPATCTGTATDGAACDLDPATDGSADCPVGCSYDNSTVMYEVTIFSGEARPGDVLANGVPSPAATGTQVFNALRICGDCGELGASAATANGGSTCADDDMAVVADTRLADCCNASVLGHVAAFGAELTSYGPASGAHISDCGNRTMEVMTLQSAVESFGQDDSGGGWVVFAVLFGLVVICCACKKIDDSNRKATSSKGRDWQVQRPQRAQQTPVVMGEFVGQSPPAVAQAVAKGQAMMGVREQPASITNNPVPRQGP